MGEASCQEIPDLPLGSHQPSARSSPEADRKPESLQGVVTRSTFEESLSFLRGVSKLSLDTETTGLRPYHGDRLFSIILGAEHGDPPTFPAYYFNFQAYDGWGAEYVLTPIHLARLKDELFSDPSKEWAMHNAKFDMAILAQEGIFLAGKVHCTRAIALVEYNEHQKYDLDSCAQRVGLFKDDTVERYIDEHDLKEKRQGPTDQYTHKFFDRVPLEIIAPYGIRDAEVGRRLAWHQEKEIRKLADATPPSLPNLRAVLENEKRLTHTVFRLEHVGVRADLPYCVRAARYESDRAKKAMASFKAATGRDFKASPKLFAEVFGSERDLWEWNKPTKTGQINPSFESSVLKRFKNPAAKAVLEYRDAESKKNFYNGFIYHADRDGIIHPTYNQDGAGHGRFSSSNPNFQNLTSEEGEIEQEFVVRRAIIPRPGFIFIMPDYDQMEYRMMFDVACDLLGYESAIVKEIKNGKDPHQATADIVTQGGTPLSRSRAKNGNFAFLYGSGIRTLADTIGATLEEARKLKNLLARAAPEVENYVAAIMSVAETRRFIFNWMGRRCYFPDPRFAYRAPNYHIAGGCADVVKLAMNRIDEYLLPMKSRMVMTVHDELPTEVHESEVSVVPRQIHEHMESVYPYKYLKLTAGMEWSDKSLADKKKGFPV